MGADLDTETLDFVDEVLLRVRAELFEAATTLPWWRRRVFFYHVGAISFIDDLRVALAKTFWLDDG